MKPTLTFERYRNYKQELYVAFNKKRLIKTLTGSIFVEAEAVKALRMLGVPIKIILGKADIHKATLIEDILYMLKKRRSYHETEV